MREHCPTAAAAGPQACAACAWKHRDALERDHACGKVHVQAACGADDRDLKAAAHRAGKLGKTIKTKCLVQTNCTSCFNLEHVWQPVCEWGTGAGCAASGSKGACYAVGEAPPTCNEPKCCVSQDDLSNCLNTELKECAAVPFCQD